MNTDLRHLPDDPFQLIAQEVAEYAIGAILFACFVADRMGWLT